MAEAADLVLAEFDVRLVGNLVASRIEYLGELKQKIYCPLSRSEFTMRDQKESSVGWWTCRRQRDDILNGEEFVPLKQYHPTSHL